MSHTIYREATPNTTWNITLTAATGPFTLQFDTKSILKPILPRFPTMPESNAFIHCKEQNSYLSCYSFSEENTEEKELSHTRVQWGWGALVKNLKRVETIWREVLPFPHPRSHPTIKPKKGVLFMCLSLPLCLMGLVQVWWISVIVGIGLDLFPVLSLQFSHAIWKT